MRLRRVSSLFLAGTALFLATAAWADAASPPKKPAPKAPAPKYQVQCQPGVMRAVVWVTGDIHGLANLSDTFTTNASMFHYRWNCTGGGIAVRKADGGFDVRFEGITSGWGLVVGGSDQPVTGSVAANPDGTFHVTTYSLDTLGDGTMVKRGDVPFIVLLF
jgi:hypothetical protein